MQKPRVIACIVVRDGIVVQSIGFKRYLPVGSPEVAAENFNRWGADEILLQDISATPENRVIECDLIERVAKNSFIPLTVAGGISSVEHIRMALNSGADKIAINSAAYENDQLIPEGSTIFGRQCIIASIDVGKNEAGEFAVFSHSGTLALSGTPDDLAKRFSDQGAGEILVNTIHRDGAQRGYDIELAQAVCSAVEIPVIICGGAGHPAHFVDGLSKSNVSAVAAANIFHFTEHSVLVAKAFIEKTGIELRHDSYADYRSHQFDTSGRVSKVADDQLHELVFQHYPKEII